MKKFSMITVMALAIFSVSAASQNPLMIEQQGSFAVGGNVKISEGTYNSRPDITQNKTSNDFMAVFKANIINGGQTLHGDHATVYY